MKFPDGFLWGAATAAHQVEGGNTNCDSWLLEHVEGTIYSEPSGDACDHYHRYADDIRLLASLGFNAYRFSIEWARIEPHEGEFSLARLDHYRRMLAACHEHGVAPERFSSFPFCVRSASWRVLLEGHRRAAQALRAGPGDFPVGMTLALRDWQAEPGGEGLCQELRARSEDVFLEAARGDD